MPASMVATSTVNVTITSPNPAIALPIGAVGGSLVVNFPISGGNTALVPIHAVGTGTVTLTATSPSGPINGEITVTITAPILIGRWLAGTGARWNGLRGFLCRPLV